MGSPLKYLSAPIRAFVDLTIVTPIKDLSENGFDKHSPSAPMPGEKNHLSYLIGSIKQQRHLISPDSPAPLQRHYRQYRN